MSNVRKSILALSALALVGGAFLASASDAEARGGRGGGRGFNVGNISQGAKGGGFNVGNISGGGINNGKGKFELPFRPFIPNFPGNGGIKPPPNNHHHHAGNRFRVVSVGFIGAPAVIDDGCVLEKRLVRGVPKIVKVCPSF